MPKIDPKHVSNIVVTGKSGAGKQPRIDVLVEEFGLEQLAMGDIFRNYLKKFNDFGFEEELERFWNDSDQKFISDQDIAHILKTDDKDVLLGMKAKYFVDKGLFVPDHITNELFESFFSKKKYHNQILDGYPRTPNQATFLLSLLKKHHSKIDFVLLVDNSDERIIARTIKRRICPKCGKVYHLDYKPPINGRCECGEKAIQRSDDTKEKIKSRLQEFKTKALPGLEVLKENNIPVVTVPGHLEEFTDEKVKQSVIDELQKFY
jgi:adenylate kinase